MSYWRSFGYAGKPGTCIWCGRRLRRKYHWSYTNQGITPGSRRAAEKLGDYEDGVFCGLRCGYDFGLRMAELGERLQRTKEAS